MYAVFIAGSDKTADNLLTYGCLGVIVLFILAIIIGAVLWLIEAVRGLPVFARLVLAIILVAVVAIIGWLYFPEILGI